MFTKFYSILSVLFIFLFLDCTQAFAINPPPQYQYSVQKRKQILRLLDLDPSATWTTRHTVLHVNENDTANGICLFDDPGIMFCDSDTRLKGNVSAQLRIGKDSYHHGNSTTILGNQLNLRIQPKFVEHGITLVAQNVTGPIYNLIHNNASNGESGIRLNQKAIILQDDQLNYWPGVANFKNLIIDDVDITLNNNAPLEVLSAYRSVLDSIYIELEYEIEIQSKLLPTSDLLHVHWLANPNDNFKPILKYYDMSTMNPNYSMFWFSLSSCMQEVKLYQVQILRLYNRKVEYANQTFTFPLNPTSYTSPTVEVPNIEAEVDWDRAVTFEVSANFTQLYNYILTEGSGYYIWRVRAISNYYDGGIANQLNWGQWNDFKKVSVSDVNNFTIGDLDYYSQPANKIINLSQSNPYGYVTYFKIDETQNWIHKRVFTEGKNNETQFHEVMAYYDNALIERQVQKRLPSDDLVILKENAPDYLGRNTLQLLPIPVRGDTNNITIANSSIKYRNNINPNYSHINYDRSGLIPDPLPANSLINQYYDGNNHLGFNLQNTGSNNKFAYFDADVPSAGSYPFSRSILSNDGLNRPEEISLPGQKFNVGDITSDTNHTIRHYYTKATEKELLSFFGVEAPDPKTVSKDILIDQNNILHISYRDMKDRVIISGTKRISTSNSELSDLKPTFYFQLNGVDLKFDNTLYESNQFKLNGALVFPVLQNINSINYQLAALPNFVFNPSCLVMPTANKTISSFPNTKLNFNLYNNKDYLLSTSNTITNLMPSTFNTYSAGFNLSGAFNISYANPGYTLKGTNTFASSLSFDKDAIFSPLFTNINNQLQSLENDILITIKNITALQNDIGSGIIKKYTSSGSSTVNIETATNQEILDAMKSYLITANSSHQVSANISSPSTKVVNYTDLNSCMNESFELDFCSSCLINYGNKKYQVEGVDQSDYAYDLVTKIIQNPNIQALIKHINDFDYMPDGSISLSQYIKNNFDNNASRNQVYDNQILLRFYSQFGLQYSKNVHLKDMDLYNSINTLYNQNFKYYDPNSHSGEMVDYPADIKCKAINTFIDNFPDNIINPKVIVFNNALDSIQQYWIRKGGNQTSTISYQQNLYIDKPIKDYFNKFKNFAKNYAEYNSICNRESNTIDVMLENVNKTYKESTPQEVDFAISDPVQVNNIILNATTQYYDIRKLITLHPKYEKACYNLSVDGFVSIQTNFQIQWLTTAAEQNALYDPYNGSKEKIPVLINTPCIDQIRNNPQYKIKEIFYDQICSYERGLRNYDANTNHTNVDDALAKLDGDKNVDKTELDKYLPKGIRDKVDNRDSKQISGSDEEIFNFNNSNLDLILDAKKRDYEVALMDFLYKNDFDVDSKYYSDLFGKRTDNKRGLISEKTFDDLIALVMEDIKSRISALSSLSADEDKEMMYALRSNLSINFDKINLDRITKKLRIPDQNVSTPSCFTYKVSLDKNARIKRDIKKLQSDIANLIHTIQNNLAVDGLEHPISVKNQLIALLTSFKGSHPNYTNLLENNLDGHWCCINEIINKDYKSSYEIESYSKNIYGDYLNYLGIFNLYRYTTEDNSSSNDIDLHSNMFDIKDRNHVHLKRIEPNLVIYKNFKSTLLSYRVASIFGSYLSNVENGKNFTFEDQEVIPDNLPYLLRPNEDNLKIYDFQINSNEKCQINTLSSTTISQLYTESFGIYLFNPVKVKDLDLTHSTINIHGKEVILNKSFGLRDEPFIPLARFKYTGNPDDCESFSDDFTYRKYIVGNDVFDINTFNNMENDCFITYHFENDAVKDIQKEENIVCSQNRLNNFRMKLLASLNQVKTHVIAEANQQVNDYMANIPSQINQSISFNYNDKITNVTLYYYDKAGNLVKTVPPLGVNFNASRTRSDVATHTMYTTYQYNTQHQVLMSKNVDEDQANVYYYNRKGQLRFSRTPKDYAATPGDTNRLSYICYDDEGRIVENGQLNTTVYDLGLNNTCSPSGSYSFQTILEDPFFPAIGAAPFIIPFCSATGSVPVPYFKKFVVITDYSENQSIPGFWGAIPERKNLRNRVNKVTRDEDGNLSTLYDQVISYYSYDLHGNVDFVIQSLPASSTGNTRLFARTDYVYDLLSHKVKEVKYNYYKSDSYTQKYSYDEDNKLTSVSSSRYGNNNEIDASYYYYPHGPLRRIELGHDHIQGLDYTYTIQGWLKAINNTNVWNRSQYDPGKDGSTSRPWFPADTFGMVLGYFNGDFSSTSNLAAIDRFAASKTMYKTSLYDGNISEMLTLRSISDNRFANYIYKYDILGRLRESIDSTHFGSYNNFSSYYNYDQNGNNVVLRRNHVNASTSAYMDNFSFTYATNRNRLTRINDTGTPIATTNAFAGAEDYVYDQSGNLKSINGTSKQMNWTADGKLKSVVMGSATGNQIAKIMYNYDASGNRVAKISQTADQINENKFNRTLYARDANGQVLAIYENENVPNGDPTISQCIKLMIYREIAHPCFASIEICNNSPNQFFVMESNGIRFTNNYIINNIINSCGTYYTGIIIPGQTLLNFSNGKFLESGYHIELVPYDVGPGVTQYNAVKTTISDSTMMPKLAEWHIYGNEQQGRFAIRKAEKFTYFMQDLDYDIKNRIFTKYFAIKSYEVKDHLGNVRAMLADYKRPNYYYGGMYYPAQPQAPYYTVVDNLSEYYPGGMPITTASPITAELKQRYGYNAGAERDNDIFSNQFGRAMTTFYREGDTYTMRWWGVDPKANDQPWQSTYSYMDGNAVLKNDPDGDLWPIIIPAIGVFFSSTQPAVPATKNHSDDQRRIQLAKAEVDNLTIVFGGAKSVAGIAGAFMKKFGAKGVKAIPKLLAKETVKEAEKEGTEKAAKSTAKKADKIVKETEEVIEDGGCFVKGTYILTSKGLKPIEQIVKGDTVWAYSDSLHLINKQIVYNTVVRKTKQLITFKVANSIIVTTPDHPFYINNKWVDAKDVQQGDSVLLFNRTKLEITNKSIKDTVCTVYNFAVKNYSTYFVSNLSVLVHNNNPCADAFNSKASTDSPTDKAAFNKAKNNNGIPKSQQPKKTVKVKDKNTGEPLNEFQFENSKGEKISIRKDKPRKYGDGGNGDQGSHYNAGTTGTKLKQHHNITPTK